MRGWEISIGFYWGILIGFRHYELSDCDSHVLYLPFFNIALNIDIDDEADW